MTTSSAAAAARRRIAVALSGGVDSSVAAYLLQQQQQQQHASGNIDLVGLHMSNWDARDEDDDAGNNNAIKCIEKEYKDAQRVAKHLGLGPVHHVSFAKEYWNGVFEPYIEAISRGTMPNPDMKCNSIVKFGAMKEYARERLGAEWIATGHYARLWNRASQEEQRDLRIPEHLVVENETNWWDTWGGGGGGGGGGDDDSPLLLSAVDTSKDQSYFLACVHASSFRNVLFPLGDLYKTTTTTLFRQDMALNALSVRQLAEEAGLPNANKRDSMGICFVGKRRKFSDFIQQYLPNQPTTTTDGVLFVDVENPNVVVGENSNDDARAYTMGQGAKISGASEKWFVVGRRADHHGQTQQQQQQQQVLLVCRGTHHPSLYTQQLEVDEMNWISGIGAEMPAPLTHQLHGIGGERGGGGSTIRVQCRVRHLQPRVDCTVRIKHPQEGQQTSPPTLVVTLDKPLRAVTEGQVCAFYLGDLCLGGGIITKRGPSFYELGKKKLEMSLLHPAGHNDLSLLGDTPRHINIGHTHSSRDV